MNATSHISASIGGDIHQQMPEVTGHAARPQHAYRSPEILIFRKPLDPLAPANRVPANPQLPLDRCYSIRSENESDSLRDSPDMVAMMPARHSILRIKASKRKESAALRPRSLKCIAIVYGSTGMILSTIPPRIAWHIRLDPSPRLPSPTGDSGSDRSKNAQDEPAHD